MVTARRRLEQLEAVSFGVVHDGRPPWRSVEEHEERERKFEELFRELDRHYIEAGEEPPPLRKGETREEVFARLFDLIEEWQKKGDNR